VRAARADRHAQRLCRPRPRFVTCPNQDVVYGLGFFSLDDEPVVMQVPDFDDRFWVYAIYDARTDQFADVGKPYGTKPGYVLLVGPNWDGKVPEGIGQVFRCSTELANTVPRVFMNDTDEDRAAIQPVVNQVVAYPLSEFDGTMKTIDWSAAPTIRGRLLPAARRSGSCRRSSSINSADPRCGSADARRGSALRAIPSHSRRGGARPAIKQALLDAAQAAEASTIKKFFEWKHNGRPAGNGWNRSTNNAEWGLDYFDRTGTAKSNMFDNKPTETQYFYTDHDSDGAPLVGTSNYQVTFASVRSRP
jgi:hypothetical protein